MTDETKGKSPEVDLLTRLTGEIEQTNWSNLVEHNDRKALFCLSANIEIIAAAMAMARDEVTYIQKWLSDGDMWKPSEDDIRNWKDNEIVFDFLIVQPYVLIQIKKDELQ